MYPCPEQDSPSKDKQNYINNTSHSRVHDMGSIRSGARFEERSHTSDTRTFRRSGKVYRMLHDWNTSRYVLDLYIISD